MDHSRNSHVRCESFRNHWNYCRGVANIDISGNAENSISILSVRKTKIDSIWPFKKRSKTLIISQISLKRPPDGYRWAIDVSVRLDQKWATCRSKKSRFREWSPFWVVRICVFKATHSDSERKSLLLFYVRTIEHYWFYNVIALSNGLWKVHFCNMVQIEPHYGYSKTYIKPK